MTEALVSELLKAIQQRTFRVGVVGLGYVGLPLVRAFLDAGFPVLGYDVDQAKIESLQAGRSYIKHIGSETIGQWLAKGMFDVTSDAARLADADALLICVPTPLNDSRDPDLSFIESTCEAIAASLRKGQLVVLESTTYPGTTRDVVAPLLERSGLRLGEFFLGYSPEREDPGNQNYTASKIPKVVGGIDQASSQLAEALYRQAVVEVVQVASCEVAEACKILENTYRAVNIALVNELKVLFDRIGLDIWEVIDAASTKPFGFQAFYPGPGLGGHCIPIDPFYLAWLSRTHEMPTRFIELAGEINTRMPQYVIERLTMGLNQQGKPVRGSRVGLIGVAYKQDVDDSRESPAFRLIELLQQRGAEISYHDPHVPVMPKVRRYETPDLTSVELTPEYLASQDAVLIVTAHSSIDWELIVAHAPLVVDTRNATRDVQGGREKIIKA